MLAVVVHPRNWGNPSLPLRPVFSSISAHRILKQNRLQKLDVGARSFALKKETLEIFKKRQKIGTAFDVEYPSETIPSFSSKLISPSEFQNGLNQKFLQDFAFFKHLHEQKMVDQLAPYYSEKEQVTKELRKQSNLEARARAKELRKINQRSQLEFKLKKSYAFMPANLDASLERFTRDLSETNPIEYLLNLEEEDYETEKLLTDPFNRDKDYHSTDEELKFKVKREIGQFFFDREEVNVLNASDPTASVIKLEEISRLWKQIQNDPQLLKRLEALPYDRYYKRLLFYKTALSKDWISNGPIYKTSLERMQNINEKSKAQDEDFEKKKKRNEKEMRRIEKKLKILKLAEEYEKMLEEDENAKLSIKVAEKFFQELPQKYKVDESEKLGTAKYKNEYERGEEEIEEEVEEEEIEEEEEEIEGKEAKEVKEATQVEEEEKIDSEISADKMEGILERSGLKNYLDEEEFNSFKEYFENGELDKYLTEQLEEESDDADYNLLLSSKEESELGLDEDEDEEEEELKFEEQNKKNEILAPIKEAHQSEIISEMDFSYVNANTFLEELEKAQKNEPRKIEKPVTDLFDEYPVQIKRRFGIGRKTLLRDRKVWIEFKVEKFNLPEPVKQRLLDILGSRYDPSTDIAKLPYDSSDNSFENKFYVKKQLHLLLAEAWKADPKFVTIEKEETPAMYTQPPEFNQEREFTLFRMIP